MSKKDKKSKLAATPEPYLEEEAENVEEETPADESSRYADSHSYSLLNFVDEGASGGHKVRLAKPLEASHPAKKIFRGAKGSSIWKNCLLTCMPSWTT